MDIFISVFHLTLISDNIIAYAYRQFPYINFQTVHNTVKKVFTILWISKKEKKLSIKSENIQI